MSEKHFGNVQPTIDNEEHEHSFNPATKRVLMYGWDGSGKKTLKTSESGSMEVMAEVMPMLRAILTAIANPSYVDKSANALRNQVQSGTITTVTTVTTVTNLTNVGSFPGNHLQVMNNITAWATNVRSLIT